MKLPVVSGRKVVKALRKDGFTVIRQRRSHIRLKKKTGDRTIKLTVPDHRSLKKKTLSRIIKEAGLTIKEFIDLL